MSEEVEETETTELTEYFHSSKQDAVRDLRNLDFKIKSENKLILSLESATVYWKERYRAYLPHDSAVP